MLRNAYKFFVLLGVMFFTSCQYQFGQGKALVEGLYFIDKFENNSEYRLLGSDFQSKIVDALRRQKGARLSDKKDATHFISGTILSVTKQDKEKDQETGRVIESQFEIKVELILKTLEEEKKFYVSNTTFKNSSGTFRIPDEASSQTLEEDEAIQESLIDLADAVFSTVSGSW